jgi:hypothetical protein
VHLLDALVLLEETHELLLDALDLSFLAPVAGRQRIGALDALLELSRQLACLLDRLRELGRRARGRVERLRVKRLKEIRRGRVSFVGSERARRPGRTLICVIL